MIAAMDRNRLIGRDNALPWRLPADLQHFKRMTLGKPLLMGRRTYESIGRPLPGRTSYILSRTPGFSVPGCRVVSDMKDAIAGAEIAGETELFICGGEDVYQQALPLCERIYLTQLEREVEGDRFFPEIPQDQFRPVRHLQLCTAEDWQFSVLQRIHLQ